MQPPKFCKQDFMDTSLQSHLDKLPCENANITLLGDFNIDLLLYK